MTVARADHPKRYAMGPSWHFRMGCVVHASIYRLRQKLLGVN
jgi:hypothetical protein